MKANKAFRKSDEAVSPVIAVILMVAITVVLAATVYVWVSGFGSQSSQPAKTMALSSSGAISNGYKNYTVASATNGLKWSDISMSLSGSTLNYDAALHTAGNGNNLDYCIVSSGTACAASAPTLVAAGQKLMIFHSTLSGQELRVLDSQANSVILTLVVG